MPKTGVLFSDFISDTIKRKSRRMKESYGRNYRTVLYQIDRFCSETGAVLYTNSINEEFLDDFIVYLESKNLKKSYIKTILDSMKAMIRKAANYGYAVDRSYDDVEIDQEEIPAVYLTMNEIARIYYFQGLTKKQERIKDLFVVGCYTALRYSDLSTLKKENFSGGYISKITKKTGARVIIPIHDFVAEIYAKYDGDISTNLSSQHFNRYIKRICEKIGISDKVTQMYTKGGIIVTEIKEKWELISSHTARRSGATNLMRTGRLSVNDIMKITGHTSEKSFMRYVKTSKEDNAKQMAGDNFFRK
jgi:integrase